MEDDFDLDPMFDSFFVWFDYYCCTLKIARLVVQWLKRSPFKRMVWGSIPRLATQWVSLVTVNMCGWDNMSLVAYSSLPRSLRINSNKPKPKHKP